MVHLVGAALAVVAAVSVAGLVSRRFGVPAPILLVAGGLVFAELPGTPEVALEPEVVLQLVLPPLLYSAALGASLLDFRANARPIALLSVGLVAATTLAVGVTAAAVVPGLSFAAACAFGAIVAPPDAVAAVAIGRRVGMPPQLQTVIEGESLVNDATALTLYGVAVAAAVGGGFSLPAAGGRFVLTAAGGAAIGLAVAYAVLYVRRRLDDPVVENVLSIATPFLAYVPAEAAHTSGVLAVVLCGLVIGHQGSVQVSSASRLQVGAVWKLVTFVLEGLVFLLIGLALPEVLRGLDRYGIGELAGAAAAVVAAVLVIRPLWVLTVTYTASVLTRVTGRDSTVVATWRQSVALSWAGMRGVVSLAAAFALPVTRHDGSPFPQRDLLLFLTFVVVVTTLLGQGLTFGTVLRRLRLGDDRQGRLLARAAARQRAISAGVRRLEEIVAAEPADDEVVGRLRTAAQARQNAAWEALGGGRPAHGSVETPSSAWRRLRREMLGAERVELLMMRDIGRLDESLYRQLERELDYEEALLDS